MRFARAIGTQLALGSIFVLTVFSTVASHGATISYGNVGPVAPGITFLNITEGSPSGDVIPLYGTPAPVPGGLNFTPTSDFVAKSTNNSGIDFTDGKLDFTVSSALGVKTISLSERGGYSLVDVGGPPTHVSAGALIIASITEVNGVAVAPINLPGVSSSFSDGLPVPVTAGSWSVPVSLNVAAGLGANQRATKVDVSINNVLIAASETNSGAIIDKKDFQIHVDTIPEPGTMLLLVIGLVGLVAKRGR